MARKAKGRWVRCEETVYGAIYTDEPYSLPGSDEYYNKAERSPDLPIEEAMRQDAIVVVPLKWEE